MIKDETIESLIDSTRDLVKDHHRKCFYSWKNTHLLMLSDFQKHISSLYTSFEEAEKNEEKLRLFFQSWSDLLEKFRDSIDKKYYYNFGLRKEEITLNFQKIWDDHINDFPEKIRITEGEDFLKPRDNDKFRTRLYKKTAGIKFRITQSLKKEKNDFQLIRPVEFRRISEALLLSATEEFIFNEFNSFLRFSMRQLEGLQNGINEMTKYFLIPEEEFPGIEEYDEKYYSRFKDRITELKEVSANLVTGAEQFIEGRDEIFEEWYKKSGENFYNVLEYAGTGAISDSKYKAAAIKKNREIFLKNFEHGAAGWKKFFSVHKEDWNNDITLMKMQTDTVVLFIDTVSSLTEDIGVILLPAFKNAADAVETTFSSFFFTQTPGARALQNLIKNNSVELLNKLRGKLLPEIAAAFLKIDINQFLFVLFEHIKKNIHKLPSEQTIMQNSDISAIPVSVTSDEAPLKELFIRDFLPVLEKNFIKEQEEIKNSVNNIMTGVSELDQVAEFNMNVTLDILKNKKDTEEAVIHVREGLQRALERIDEHIEKATGVRNEIEKNLHSVTAAYITNIQELLDNQRLIELKLQLVRIQAKENLQKNIRGIWAGISKTLPLIWSGIIKISEFVRARFGRYGEITGLMHTSESRYDIYEYFKETKTKIEQLPFIYQHLFGLKPLADERLFAGREKELRILTENLKQWESGAFMSTIIIGEHGSGATTLLNFAKRDIYREFEIKELNLKKTLYIPEGDFQGILSEVLGKKVNNFDDVQRYFISLDKPLVFIVENVQNLFLRTVRGFELLNKFISLIYNTGDKVHWIFTCTLYSWEYLDKALNISKHFQSIISLSGIAENDLENIIMKRHRITGYQLEFLAPENIIKTRQYKKLKSRDDQQNYLKRYFFNQLFDIAKGNISITILFWLRSITEVEENKLKIYPLIDVDYSFLYKLSAIELFTLGALLQHEMLNAKSHSLVFRQSVESSSILLNSLFRKGIIIEAGSGYRIHPFLYRPVVKALINNNILH